MRDNPERRKLKQFFTILAAATLFGCNNVNTPVEQKAIVTDTVSQPAITQQAKKAPRVTKKILDAGPIVLDTNKRYIFLTFDDGPQPPGSNICFNIFRQSGVKATFFNISDQMETKGEENLVDSIRNSYPNYLLANHSKSHAFNNKYFYFYHHPQDAAKDFFACQQKLNIPFKIARLPGNSAWVRQGEIKASGLVRPVCRLLDSAGYNVIGWDLEWGFKTKNHQSVPVQSANTMVKMIDYAFTSHHSHSLNTVVLLAHDRMFAHPNYADSLSKCIAMLKKDPRYVFETIDHYPGIKHSKN